MMRNRRNDDDDDDDDADEKISQSFLLSVALGIFYEYSHDDGDVMRLMND